MLFREEDGWADWVFRGQELKILLSVFPKRLELNKVPFTELLLFSLIEEGTNNVFILGCL